VYCSNDVVYYNCTTMHLFCQYSVQVKFIGGQPFWDTIAELAALYTQFYDKQFYFQIVIPFNIK